MVKRMVRSNVRGVFEKKATNGMDRQCEKSVK